MHSSQRVNVAAVNINALLKHGAMKEKARYFRLFIAITILKAKEATSAPVLGNVASLLHCSVFEQKPLLLQSCL